MFEKKSEEIAERKISDFIPQQWGVSLIRTEPTYETVEGAPHFYLNSLAKMWKDGAEFGYKKGFEECAKAINIIKLLIEASKKADPNFTPLIINQAKDFLIEIEKRRQ